VRRDFVPEPFGGARRTLCAVTQDTREKREKSDAMGRGSNWALPADQAERNRAASFSIPVEPRSRAPGNPLSMPGV
jgi:hypothetical protein